MACFKHCVIAANLLISLLGAVIVALGIWLKVDKDFWHIQQQLALVEFKTSTTILVVVGVVIVVIGLCGCRGVISSKSWMLVLFSAIMIIVLLVMAVTVLVWYPLVRESMTKDMRSTTRYALRHMNYDQDRSLFINLIQKKFQCCGIDGPWDYNPDPQEQKPLPNSCIPTNSATPYEKGCFNALFDFLRIKAAIISGGAVAVLLLQIAILVSCYIYSMNSYSKTKSFMDNQIMY